MEETKMKKIIAIAFAAIIAGFAISCQKEESVSDKADAVQYTFNIVVSDQAGFDNDASTKGSEYHKSYWENGDKIFLFFRPTDENLLNTYATLTYYGSYWDVYAPGLPNLGEDGTLSAVYVYNLDGDVYPEFSSADNQWTIATGNTFYNCETVTYAVSDNVISAFLNLKAPTNFVRFYVEGATGVLTCDNVKGWKDIAIGSDMAISNVTCTGYMDGFTNSGDSNVKEYYGRIVNDGTSLNGEVCEFSVVKNGKVYERPATPSSDARSFKMTVSTEQWTEAKGKLPGLFTVGNGADGTPGTEDDVQVRFSQGNLTCDISGATPDWKFYEHQYDCAKDNPVSTTLISLFTFGYGDWSTDPTGTGYQGGASFTDWGTKIGDGKIWHTLDSGEWNYLFNSRAASTVNNTPNARYAKATVKDIKGVILLPDAYTHPGGVDALQSINTADAAFTANSYNLDAWEKMEFAGAVFLPAAGYRDCQYDKKLYHFGEWCDYWSSTPCTSSAADAYFAHITDTMVNVHNWHDRRNSGLSVRLVWYSEEE